MGTKYKIGFTLALGLFLLPHSSYAYTPSGENIGSQVVDNGSSITVPWVNPPVVGYGCGGTCGSADAVGGYKVTSDVTSATTTYSIANPGYANYAGSLNGNVKTVTKSSLILLGDSTDGTYYYEIMSAVDYNNGYPANSHYAPTVAYFTFVISSGGTVVTVENNTTATNEVLQYYPSFGVSTSTGTTTVGAQFSIGNPSWIVGVGYRILDYNGSIVYDASTTVTTASTFSITTNYNFTTPGVTYQGHAYFIQDLGDGNTWEVDNPTVQQILVDNQQWTIDPVTGAFSPPSTTTIATSTLDNFKITCPDDVITGSFCKLVVGLFVPNGSSINGVKNAFNNLLQKAPFSFFLQSKSILDSFRIGSATTGGAFSLTVYGQTVPIVSQTTASAVGLTTDTINILKGVMVVGLWLMLAWYLYWRVASIFGV